MQPDGFPPPHNPDDYLPPNEPYFPDRPPADYDLRRVADGLCPVLTHGPLTAVPGLDYAGWCLACGLGWAPADHSRDLTMYLRPKQPPSAP